jgi:hypothetical protein
MVTLGGGGSGGGRASFHSASGRPVFACRRQLKSKDVGSIGKISVSKGV